MHHEGLHSEAVTRRSSVQKLFSKFSTNSQENACGRVFFKHSCRLEACNFTKKETLAQVLSCQFFEIFKNTFFYRTPPLAAFLQSVTLY